MLMRSERCMGEDDGEQDVWETGAREYDGIGRVEVDGSAKSLPQLQTRHSMHSQAPQSNTC